MSRRIDKRAMELLRLVADFQTLVFTQLSIVGSKSLRTVRQWMKDSADDSPAKAIAVPISSGQGRLVGAFYIRKRWLGVQKSEGTLAQAVGFNRAGKSKHADDRQSTNEGRWSRCQHESTGNS